MNRSCLVGRLTKDPELRYSPSGVAVTNFTLAVDRGYKGQDGVDVDFIPIVTFKQTAESCANFLRKGRLASIESRIQTRNYENNEGRRVYVTEIVADNVRFLEKANNKNSADESSKASSSKGPDPFEGDGKPIDISDDDLPF
jgi:single-strand DNA-binding protein